MNKTGTATTKKPMTYEQSRRLLAETRRLDWAARQYIVTKNNRRFDAAKKSC